MQLFSGKARTPNSRSTRTLKSALAAGAVLILASSFTSATVIGKTEHGFDGWYAPKYWETTGNVQFSADNTMLTFDASDGVEATASILMPSKDQFDGNKFVKASVRVFGDFAGTVLGYEIDNPKPNASVSFLPGQQWPIVVSSGSMELYNFRAPAAAVPAVDVPEPGALALLSLGLVGVGATRVYRKRK